VWQESINQFEKKFLHRRKIVAHGAGSQHKNPGDHSLLGTSTAIGNTSTGPADGRASSTASNRDSDDLTEEEIRAHIDKESTKIWAVESYNRCKDPHMERAIKKMAEKSNLHVAAIRDRKNMEQAVRIDRERRYSRAHANRQRERDANLELKKEQIVLKVLSRQSRAEREIARKLLMLRSEKQRMKENREHREVQYKARRQQDFEDAMLREKEIGKRARLDYETTAENAKRYRSEMRKQQLKRIRNEHLDAARGIVQQIIELAIKVSEYRELSDLPQPPASVQNDWMQMFVAGTPLTYLESAPPTLAAFDTNYAVNLDQVDPAKVSNRELLNVRSLASYMFLGNDWCEGLDEETIEAASVKNDTLSHIVQQVFTSACPRAPEPIATDLPASKMRLVIMGKSFSGKTVLAQHLEAKYGLKRLNIEDIITTALAHLDANTLDAYVAGVGTNTASGGSTPVVPASSPPVAHGGGGTSGNNAADGGGTSTDEGPGDTTTGVPAATGGVQHDPDQTRLVQLVRDAKEALLAGHGVAPETQAALIAHRIRTLGHEVEETGWVVDGFPKTVEQARMLQWELSGKDPQVEDFPAYEVPSHRSNIQPPNAHEDPDLIETPRRRCMDIVLHLECGDDEAIRRALGRRVDPLDQTVYHFDTALHPSGEMKDGIGPHQRMQEVNDDSNTHAQLHVSLSVWNEECALLAKFYEDRTRFVSLPAGAPPDVVAVATDAIDAFIAQQQHEHDGDDASTSGSGVHDPASAGTSRPGTGGNETSFSAPESGGEDATGEDSPPRVSPVPDHQPSADVGGEKPADAAGSDIEQGQGSAGSQRLASATSSTSPSSARPATSVSTGDEITEGEGAEGEAGEEDGVSEVEVADASPKYIQATVSDEMSRILATHWRSTEQTFIMNVKRVLEDLRVEEDRILRHLYATRSLPRLCLFLCARFFCSLARVLVLYLLLFKSCGHVGFFRAVCGWCLILSPFQM